jgi:activating signal cointegrator complex subunit 3
VESNSSFLSTVELGSLLRNTKMGDKVKECLNYLPKVEIDTSLHPITRTVLRVKISLTPVFSWNDRVHGMGSEAFWVWIEDPFHNHIYHHEFVNIAKKQVKAREPHQLVFTIPIFEPLPPQYIVSTRRAG